MEARSLNNWTARDVPAHTDFDVVFLFSFSPRYFFKCPVTFFFLIFIYLLFLAASGLSCGMQNLSCGVWASL